MHVSPGYFKDVPGMQGGVGQQPQQQPAVDVVKLIASWAPRSLNAGEVRALLGEAVKAATVLKARVPADIYSQVAAALKTFADIAGQTAGKAADAKLLTTDQAKLVLAAIVQFWRVAHAAGVASQTTVDLSGTQAIFKRAKTRSSMGAMTMQQQTQPAPQEEPVPEKKGMPTWGWVAIGVTVLAAVGTVIAVLVFRKRDELPEGAEPLEPEAGETEEKAA